jgi:hypothetical protein
VSLLRRSSAPAPDTDKQAKAAARARRMELVREARKASSAMQSPEPSRGLLVSAYLVAVGILSFVSKDLANETIKVHGKTETVQRTIAAHNPTAIAIVVLALGAAATIYWRRRYLTGISFMLTAAIGISVPFPKGLQDLVWLTFIVPAAYVLWMLMFRMNKEQKNYMAAIAPAGATGGTAARSTSRSSSAAKARTSGARSRRGSDEPVVTASGKPLPPSSGRYTRPQQKARAGARKP